MNDYYRGFIYYILSSEQWIFLMLEGKVSFDLVGWPDDVDRPDVKPFMADALPIPMLTTDWFS